MAYVGINIPIGQPLRFVPVDGEVPVDPRDNIKHFDAEWFKLLIRDWQYTCEYNQPWQLNDRMSVYLNTTSTRGYKMELIDCNQRIWQTWTDTNFIFQANNKFNIGTRQEQAYAYYMKWRFSDIPNLPEGIYWLYITANFRTLGGPGASNVFRHMISEPLHIAPKHPGTVRVDYTNSIATEEIMFPIVNAQFSQRVHADIVDFRPASTDTQYEDGEYNPNMLASQTYRSCKFALTRRVPEWVVDKLNRAFGCNRVSVDSKGFTKEIGAKWEINSTARVPKIIAALPIREAENNSGATTVYATSFRVYSRVNPLYSISDLKLNDGTMDVLFLQNVRVVHDATEETTFLSQMNAIAGSQGYNGSFSLDNGDVIWTNGAGDMFVSATAMVRQSPLIVSYASNTQLFPIRFINPNLVLDYGDGTQAATISQAGSVTTANHPYATTTARTVYIFGDYELISFDDGFVSGFSGFASYLCRFFEVRNSFSITSFNCSILTPCDYILQTWRVYSCQNLTALTSLNSLTLPVINALRMTSNKFNSQQASDVVIRVYQSVDTIPKPSGSLSINGQTPPAPMNVTGGIAKSVLTDTYSWSVTTD